MNHIKCFKALVKIHTERLNTLIFSDVLEHISPSSKDRVLTLFEQSKKRRLYFRNGFCTESHL